MTESMAHKIKCVTARDIVCSNEPGFGRQTLPIGLAEAAIARRLRTEAGHDPELPFRRIVHLLTPIEEKGRLLPPKQRAPKGKCPEQDHSPPRTPAPTRTRKWRHR